jgi:hypothetical protein
MNDERPEIISVPGVPGAEVREVPRLATTLESAVSVGGYSIARAGHLLLTVPKVGRFLASDGNLIQMVRESGANPLEVEQYLFGSARAALVHQRGGLPLHSSCISPPDRKFAVAITGPSGAGKSTLAAELVRRGWLLLGDDVTPLYSGSDSILAWPSQRGLKLWRDACESLSIELQGKLPLPGERDKFFMSVVTETDPLPLRYIFQLERGANDAMSPILGPMRLAVLRANTYKANYLMGLKCVESHFRISCQISAKVEMNALRWLGPVSRGADILTSFITPIRS